MDEWWACEVCHSINRPSASACYSCRSPKGRKLSDVRPASTSEAPEPQREGGSGQHELDPVAVGDARRRRSTHWWAGLGVIALALLIVASAVAIKLVPSAGKNDPLAEARVPSATDSGQRASEPVAVESASELASTTEPAAPTSSQTEPLVTPSLASKRPVAKATAKPTAQPSAKPATPVPTVAVPPSPTPTVDPDWTVVATVTDLVPSVTSDPSAFDDVTWQVMSAAPGAVCRVSLWSLSPDPPWNLSGFLQTFIPGKANKHTDTFPVNAARGTKVEAWVACSLNAGPQRSSEKFVVKLG
jgi:hypothetical protein